ncbi:hypothetical protein [Shewanella vesiculosa]|uniref:hypothetical protein n=1 Tax=Shewanella vesiculosa TaxID=518738 RepID=UPI002359AD63|nr:hypothetical protein [Shewanella vesiculosa]
MADNFVLISIHPEHVVKILSGEKKLEFRRRWTTKKVVSLVIYETSPTQKIVAIANVKTIYRGTKSRLWELSKIKGGGISKARLFEYIGTRTEGVAIELSEIINLGNGLSPALIFGKGFHPPQSFRYIKENELKKLKIYIGE